MKTIFLSDTGTVCEPFYSVAMKCWRVEFLGFPISDFRKQRQSSYWCDTHEDALIVYGIVKGITDWTTWVAAGVKVRSALVDGSGMFVWRSGITGANREIFHRDSISA